ncbi:uncharacterized protein LOC144355695 [Saccoglossus kowalevskii]
MRVLVATMVDSTSDYFQMAEELSLRSRALSSFPLEACENTSLKRLDCQYNALKTLPGKLKELENLEELVISCNKFREIPSVVFKLSHLVVLDISYNDLTQLPIQIYELKLLEKLDASYNKIQSLPSQFGMRMKNLETVFLYGNPLSDPPTDICSSGIEAIRDYQIKKTGADQKLTYIVGDSTIKNINRGTLLGNVKITIFNEATMKKIHFFLNKKADLKNVRTLIIHVGSDEVSIGKFEVIKQAVLELRSIIKDVNCRNRNVHIVISGNLPRNDCYCNDARLMNDFLRAVAAEDDCLFIDHEGLFLKRNGEMDGSFFVDDNFHLNSRGTMKAALSFHKTIPILKNHPGKNPFME